VVDEAAAVPAALPELAAPMTFLKMLLRSVRNEFIIVSNGEWSPAADRPTMVELQ
jgi:hypothetical protein